MGDYISKYTGEQIDERLEWAETVPTKVSDLENDEDFIKSSDVQPLSSQEILELLT